MVTFYASFPDAANGEKALGALLDHGAQPVDLTAFFPYDFETPDGHEKLGVTTAAADAPRATTQSVVGQQAGTLAALLSQAVPGFGVVTGGGALASAIGAVVGSTVGGALTGGVAGFLQDQGVATKIACNSESALRNGETVLVVKSPSGALAEELARDLLLKYDGHIFGCIEEQ